MSPSERPVRIFVTDARLDRMPLYAAAVKARHAVSPTIWLVTGDLFADKSLAALSEGAAQQAVLSRAGVDAVVLTPTWLSLGLHRVNEIVAGGRYYSLSASLVDTSRQAIGQPFMVKKSGPAVIAITGIALDSANVFTHLVGVRYVSPGMAAGMAFALMRQRADLIGVMAEPYSAGSAWGADFAVNRDTSGAFTMTASNDSGFVNCYDVSADAGHITAKTTGLGLYEPDSDLVQVVDSVRAVADSVAARSILLPDGASDGGQLGSVLIQGVLAAGLAEGFLCDSLFVADFKEPQDVGSLVSLLRDPGRLALLSVQGEELAGWPEELVLRPGLTRAGLTRGQTYRVATTVDYLQRHREMVQSGFVLTARPFWTICLDILESGAVK
ncbi:hypothetical protein JXD38_03665 [candidate division WOR-3 bacterium]|nr:hypothetical protein [candidate division WOR-3 bacterium]